MDAVRSWTGAASRAVVLVALLTGCVSPEIAPDVSEDGPQGPPEGPQDPDGPDRQVATCDEPTVEAIDDVIGQQLAAFADDDFSRALELASESFRAGVDAEALADIIEQGYPVAADAVGHQTGVCVRPTPTTAEALVEVTGRDGDRGDLVYRLVEEDAGWRIAGALEADEAESPSGPATTVSSRR